MPGPLLPAGKALSWAAGLAIKHSGRIAKAQTKRAKAKASEKSKANKAIDKKVSGTIRSSNPSPSSQEAAVRNLQRLRKQRAKHQGN